MSPWKTRARWAKGTYMRLKSKDDLREYLVTKEDVDAHRSGKAGAQKMSQRGLADRVGVDPSFINHLTSGRRSTCTPYIAERIAEVLGVPVKVLFLPTAPSNARRIPASQMARAA